MKDTEASVFDHLCVKLGRFYLPTNLENNDIWPVMACDQYTTQKNKWEEADQLVGNTPSTLRMIIPEAYLDESDKRIPRIWDIMKEYLKDDVLTESVNGIVLVARTTQSGRRLGLVMTIDMEAYEYTLGTHSLIRPTEETIMSRIPPRIKVRKNALLELSHILLLCNDVKRTVIEPLFEKRGKFRPLYDIKLMLNGGRLQGWAVEETATLSTVANALAELQNALMGDNVLFAVGDGNHSLATAKRHWEDVKALLPETEWVDHPARFAMVELNNIYDEALIFTPIHRVLFNITKEQVLYILKNAALVSDTISPDMTLVTAEGDFNFHIENSIYPLPLSTIQKCLDQVKDLQIDYVHGEEIVRKNVCKQNTVGILLPVMDKTMLFPAIMAGNVLPKKTFSIGEANEKRYYMEARRITSN
ncbi:MAG: DUF1015 domain-containing protein [Christensenellales bacterium]